MNRSANKIATTLGRTERLRKWDHRRRRLPAVPAIGWLTSVVAT
jgi:hypothetical protein